MKTIRIKIYKFEELSKEAQINALEKMWDINVDFGWWDFIYDDAKEIGLKITSFELDRNRNAKGEFILSASEVCQNIFNNHGEQCETYKTSSNFIQNWQPIFDDYMNEDSENYESQDLEETMQDLENDFLNSLLEDYSIMLQNDYEYNLTDEAVTETIIANEYDFLKDGTQY